MKCWIVGFAVLVVLGPVGSAEATVNIDLVTVGNPHNAGDEQAGGAFGAVNYVYQIGKYEVSKNQWDAAVDSNMNDLLSDAGYWSGNQPVAMISWDDAAMFCNWLTSGDVTQGAYAIDGSGQVTAVDRAGAVSVYGTVYVIPTEDEWYKAAYYDPDKGGAGVPGYWDYPTKHDDPNVPDGIDSAEDTAFDAVFYQGYDQGHPNDVDNAGVLSAYGTMGQGGNVWEWNETVVSSPSRGQRGGHWDFHHPGYLSSDYLNASCRGAATPSVESYNLGFRVACVPEPATLALLAGIAVTGSVCWRRREA